ncbi:hypothetical protein LPJ73_000544 [Coemansia sp. RSA 2703]|nr:hypothetical protein LPJ73_000544 [Coemansia sp. RSA 2703]
MNAPTSTPVSTSRAGAEKRKLPLSAIPQPRTRRLSPLAPEESSQQKDQREPMTLSTCTVNSDANSVSTTSTAMMDIVAPQAFSRNHAIRAMGRQGALPRTSRHKANLPAGLASPTDKLMSPATRGVNKLRHKKIEHLPKPRALSSLFESMKDKK